MPDSDPSARFKINAWILFAAAAFFVVGLILLFIAIQLPPTLGEGETTKPNYFAQGMSQLATILIISGVWSAVYDFLVRREFIRILDQDSEKITANLTQKIESIRYERVAQIAELTQQIAKSDEDRQLGMRMTWANCKDINFKSFLNSGDQLDIVMNDGQWWLSSNHANIEQRFLMKGGTTRVFLVDPKSIFIDILASKVGRSAVELGSRIKKTVDELQAIDRPDHNLEIYFHNLYNPYSLFLSNKGAFLTFYYFSTMRIVSPAFWFEPAGEDCQVERFKKDIEQLISDSAQIHPKSETAPGGLGAAEQADTAESRKNKKKSKPKS